MAGDWEELFNLAFVSALLIGGWLLIRWDRRRTSRHPVRDGPENEPYRVHTREFDLVLAGADVPGRLREASPDFLKGRSDRDGSGWEQACELAGAFEPEPGAADKYAERLAASLHLAGIANPAAEVAITILLDQSGSMRGTSMAAAQAALACIADAIATTRAQLEILGFSSAGWHGGHAYQRWLHGGRPKRPGRLCALLHVIYKPHAELLWSEASRRAMLHPDILRENIDGEALRWAAERLRQCSAPRKLLIVISDGAPVDDATLLHNGAAYLERDLRRAIAAIEADGFIDLGGVGLRHSVDQYYGRSRLVEEPGLTEGIIDLLTELIESRAPISSIAGSPASHTTR